MTVISGEVRARLFGKPGQVDRVTYVTPWGIKVSIHPQILARFRAACELAAKTVKWTPQRIDSYNDRPIRGYDGSSYDEWSLHAWALAFDFFATPPNVPPPGGVWTPTDGVPAAFAECFTRYGFRWGATFARKDVPHIEWAQGLPAPLNAPEPPEEDDMPPAPSVVVVNGVRFRFVLADQGIWYREGDTTWQRIPGGTLTSAPGAWATSDGSIVVTARGADGGTWETTRTPQGKWEKWADLGGKS